MRTNDNGVDRDMTADEVIAHQAFQVTATAELKARTDAETARQVARQVVLDKLGLTADEAKVLLG